MNKFLILLMISFFWGCNSSEEKKKPTPKADVWTEKTVPKT